MVYLHFGGVIWQGNLHGLSNTGRGLGRLDDTYSTSTSITVRAGYLADMCDVASPVRTPVDDRPRNSVSRRQGNPESRLAVPPAGYLRLEVLG